MLNKQTVLWVFSFVFHGHMLLPMKVLRF